MRAVWRTREQEIPTEKYSQFPPIFPLDASLHCGNFGGINGFFYRWYLGRKIRTATYGYPSKSMASSLCRNFIVRKFCEVFHIGRICRRVYRNVSCLCKTHKGLRNCVMLGTLLIIIRPPELYQLGATKTHAGGMIKTFLAISSFWGFFELQNIFKKNNCCLKFIIKLTKHFNF